MFDLTGRVAIITGAASGIGWDAAKGYAEAGADVALIARRRERLEELAAEIEAETGRAALAVPCDVADEDSVRGAVGKIIDRFGKIDILFNNAGVNRYGSVETLSAEDWDYVFGVNVRGMFLMCKYVIPHMRKAKYGKVVNVSSVNAIVSEANEQIARHAYNASKGGVRGLTIGMACLYGQDNITVNAIGPGMFETEMTGDFFAGEAYVVKSYSGTAPMKRQGRRGELNGTVLYLSSDASSYTTGQYICVDGGFTSV